MKSTKNPRFRTFFEILVISLEIPSISNSRCEKPNISKFLIRNTYYFDRNPKFLIEILIISIEILGFSFEILGISKICDNHIPYPSDIKYEEKKSCSSTEYCFSF